MKYKMLQYIKNGMKEKEMKVNQEKLLKIINQKWKTKFCPMCGKNDWTINNDMMTMLGVGEDKSIQLGGKIVPVVAITCNECGNTIFVNPLAIGCVDE